MKYGSNRLRYVAGLDSSVLNETLLGHEIGSSNCWVLESECGGAYTSEQLFEGARNLWAFIEQLPATTRTNDLSNQ